MVRKGEMMDVDDIVDLLSIDLIGVVPDDEYIITQTNKGEPVIQNKKAPSGKSIFRDSKKNIRRRHRSYNTWKRKRILGKNKKRIFGKK